jgi:hypothetical protein
MKVLKTHSTVDTEDLPDRQANLYRQALKRYRAGTSWIDFEEFVFGPGSPIYDDLRAHADVIGTPLYEALKAMWLDLGVQQGMVKPEEPKRAARRK